MTPERYYAAVRALGLRPSSVPNVYIDRDGMPFSVPDPGRMTPDQREDTLAKIRFLMGR